MPNLQPPKTNSERIETLLHQLRNPLTALNTFAKLLDKRSPSDDPNRWILERIERECNHMRSLLDRFEIDAELAPSSDADAAANRASSKIELALKPFLEELWPTYATLAQECAIEARLDVELEPQSAVTVNPLGLREAIDNLMDNALKYTLAGGTVTLAAREEEDKIAIQVGDTGPGIASSDLPQIFDRHFRVEGSQPGQGLGLAIARDLVTDMGGELTVQSRLGHGTEFTIRLPR
ncbi:MAG: sensor histidine kinase [Synechococcus sp.]